MVSSYEKMMGTPMDVDKHPARTSHSATLRYAGDVIPFPGQTPSVPRVGIKMTKPSGVGVKSGIPRNIDYPANENK